MAADTPEALNAELLARIVELERELAQPRAKRDLERPTLPSDDEIARARRAARDALVAQAAEHVASWGSSMVRLAAACSAQPPIT